MNRMVTHFERLALVVVAIAICASSQRAEAQRTGLFELWVGHELVDCPSDPARLCYQVKNEQYDEWRAFEGSLSNFYYREGVAYILLVESDPTLDDRQPSRTRYKVVQVLEEFETFETPEIPNRVATPVEEDDIEPIASEPIEPPAPSPALVEAPIVVAEPAPAPSPPTPAPTKEPTPGPTPAAEPAAAPLPPPARTSPAAGRPFRGSLIIGSGTEARSFTPCGEEAGIWIEDESGQELWKIYRGSVPAPNRPLLIDVRGEMRPAPRSGFGAHYDHQLTVIEVLEVHTSETDCARIPAPVTDLPPTSATAQAAPQRAQPASEPDQITISGGAPLWSLRIGSGGISYTGPSGTEPINFPPATPERSASRDTYVTSTTGVVPHALKVVIGKEPCPDPASGIRREFTAYITLDGRWLRGCVTQGEPLSSP